MQSVHDLCSDLPAFTRAMKRFAPRKNPKFRAHKRSQGHPHQAYLPMTEEMRAELVTFSDDEFDADSAARGSLWCRLTRSRRAPFVTPAVRYSVVK